jgi:hypothetical protein
MSSVQPDVVCSALTLAITSAAMALSRPDVGSSMKMLQRAAWVAAHARQRAAQQPTADAQCE